MTIRLSDHFTFSRLLRFTLPSMLMMVFMSVYSIADGFFVSNFAGKNAFTAVNLVWPLIMILATVGFMFGTGGSALVAKTMGEGDKPLANRYFSLFIYISAAIAAVFTVLGVIFMRPLSLLLGAEGELIDLCVIYGRILILALPGFILQNEFQTFFVTAEKPNPGFFITVISGVSNMALDALLVAVLNMGLTGAAVATALSQYIGAVIAVIYFASDNKSLLRLGKTKFYGKAVLKACANGSSEFMNNVAMSLVGILYNWQLILYAGENGVAAYGVLMYVSFIFAAVFIGFSMGSSPLISFNFGAQNHRELNNIFKKSFVIVTAFSLVMAVLSEALAYPLSYFYVGYDSELVKMTVGSFRVFSFAYLFMGVASFGSGLFTALNDGLTSAMISFLRTLVFEVAAVMLLPVFFGVDGIWASGVVSEFMAASLSAVFILLKRKKFRYFYIWRKTMDLFEAMHARHTVRKFEEKPISEELVIKLDERIEQLNREYGLKIMLITDSGDGVMGFAKLLISKNANNYFLLAGEDTGDLDEKIGYCGADLMLYAQTLGLNTWWNGGMYNRRATQKNAGQRYKTMGVIVVGYGQTQGVAHKSKSAEEISAYKGETPRWFRNGVEALLLAPTALNKQAFKVRGDNNKVILTCDNGVFSGVDLGIGKYHFELGAGKDNFEWI